MATAQQLIAADRGLWQAERAPIAGRYEVCDELGGGDAAVVYRAADRLRECDVVLKLLHPRCGAEPALVERFRRAMAATSRLDHPSVVRVIDYGVIFDYDADGGAAGVPGRPFVVSELMLGGNLRTTLQDRGLLPEAVALTLAAGVAEALATAHQAGVLHGDLKPQNVLLDERGRPRVSDFALAQAIGQAAANFSVPGAGMMCYRSPEQAQGRVVDGRSDLYSLGVLLYELLTGQLPFNGVSMLAVAMRHVQREPGRSREVLPLFSPSTGAIILKALKKDPAERYQTAAEMRAALVQARAEAVDATARPSSPAESTALLASSVVRQSAPDVREIGGGRAAEAFPQSVSVSPPARRATGRPNGRRLAAVLSVIGLSLIGSLALAGRLVGDADGLLRSGSAPSAAPERDSALAVAPPAVASPRQTELFAPPPAAPASPLVAALVPPAGAAPTDAPSMARVVPEPVVEPTPAPPEPAIAGPGVPADAVVIPAPPVVVAAAPVVPAGAAGAAPPASLPVRPLPAAQLADTAAPSQAVVSFYSLAAGGRFDGAAGLWSARMLAAYPPGENITRRFSQTRGLTVQRAETIAHDPVAGRATVAIELVEVVGAPAIARRYVGTWQLVRGPGGWLLDQPNLRLG